MPRTHLTPRLLSVLLVWAVLAGQTDLRAQDAIGYEQLTVSTSALPITLAVRSGASQCRGRLETAAIRVIWSGATPTTSVGAPVQVGDEVVLGTANDVANFKAITANSSGPSGVLNMACVKGTAPIASAIQPTTVSLANLPACNSLLRAAGAACRG